MNVLARLTTRWGSTRPMALLRMALVAAAWSEWASGRLLYRGDTIDEFVVSVAFFVLSSLAFVGLWTLVSTAAFGALAMALVYGYGWYGGVEDYWHHHSKLLAHALFLVALTPCGGALSVDRWRAVSAAERAGVEPPSTDGDLWATRLLCVAQAVVWFWGAWDKVEWDFLSGGRLTQIFVGHFTHMNLAQFQPTFAPLMTVASFATVGLEFALALGLWFRRLRPWLVPAAVLLHGTMYMLLPVGTFSVTMMLLLLAWFEPDEIEAVWSKLEGGRSAPG